jgi:hypothetical protein
VALRPLACAGGGGGGGCWHGPSPVTERRPRTPCMWDAPPAVAAPGLCRCTTTSCRAVSVCWRACLPCSWCTCTTTRSLVRCAVRTPPPPEPAPTHARTCTCTGTGTGTGTRTHPPCCAPAVVLHPRRRVRDVAFCAGWGVGWGVWGSILPLRRGAGPVPDLSHLPALRSITLDGNKSVARHAHGLALSLPRCACCAEKSYRTQSRRPRDQEGASGVVSRGALRVTCAHDVRP